MKHFGEMNNPILIAGESLVSVFVLNAGFHEVINEDNLLSQKPIS